MKYQPKSREQLQALCNDVNVELGEINVSRFTNFSFLFSNSCRTSKQFEGIEKWDVSKGKNFAGMFCGAKSFNQEISGWLHERAFNQFMFDDEVLHLITPQTKKHLF
ncbi:hypothetical protein HpCK38_16230 [Helicobacter pylori]